MEAKLRKAWGESKASGEEVKQAEEVDIESLIKEIPDGYISALRIEDIPDSGVSDVDIEESNDGG